MELTVSTFSLTHDSAALLLIAIRYTYESIVIDKDPFVTARREIVEADEWEEQSPGLWTRNETVLKRHGIAFSFSQEGL
eukprot:COSAG02_NODE_27467_length_609_cov_0.707843_1_plen_78_part_10